MHGSAGLPLSGSVGSSLRGATENAGPENDGPIARPGNSWVLVEKLTPFDEILR